jgi:hypothetical protein
MTKKTPSQNDNSANAQPPVPTWPLKETAIADNPGQAKAARRAISVNQGAVSVLFTKLIADQTSASPQILDELRVWSYGAYTHWGLND